jgi:NAD(P)H-dependent FMN reductase
VYGHLIPGANKAAVDRLDEATIRNPAATGVSATVAGSATIGAQMPDTTVHVYWRHG